MSTENWLRFKSPKEAEKAKAFLAPSMATSASTASGDAGWNGRGPRGWRSASMPATLQAAAHMLLGCLAQYPDEEWGTWQDKD